MLGLRVQLVLIHQSTQYIVMALCMALFDIADQ